MSSPDDMRLTDDVIHSFLNGCFKAGIKNPVSFLLSKRPQVYDWLRGVFPRGVIPTDIDGEVELGGKFLRLEFKDEMALRQGWVPQAQRELFRKLVDTKFHTIFIIGVNRIGEPVCTEVYRPDGILEPLTETSREQLRERFKNWAKWAEGKVD